MRPLAAYTLVFQYRLRDSIVWILPSLLMVLVLIPSVMMLLRKYNWGMPGARQPDALVAME